MNRSLATIFWGDRHLSTELAVREAHLPAKHEFSESEKDLIKKTICDGATDGELQLFMHQCIRTGMDPFSRQIYWMKVGGKPVVITSIDGFRLVASRSGHYQGQTPPQWCGRDGKWRDIWLDREPPAGARVGVYRAGFKEPLYGVAAFSSYNRGHGQWKQMPDVMLSKCAEALALRKAFPNDLSGLYTSDELPQGDGPIIIQGGGQDLGPLEMPHAPLPRAEPKLKEMADDEVYEGLEHQKKAFAKALMDAYAKREYAGQISKFFREKHITKAEFRAALNEYAAECPMCFEKPTGGPTATLPVESIPEAEIPF